MTAIDPIYLLLAYAGMVIFTLMKIEEDRKRGLLESWTMWKNWLKSNAISIIISLFSIPVLLYICTDPLIKTYFPISIPTSVIIGFQTQGIFRSIMTISTPKSIKDNLPANDNK